MAKIDSKILFITTSPRTPAKMIPEIKLLCDHFSGAEWNHATQVAFMELLRTENFFHGHAEKDPAFSARDRINRAPQALGFVKLKPTIALTPAGERLVRAKRKEEVFLKQLLKFQLPSPYHIAKEGAEDFFVRPYLEIFRLIQYFGSLLFDELMFFGLQLTRYDKFDEVVGKIEQFRKEKALNRGRYKRFRAACLDRVISEIYADEFATGKTKTRESRDDSPQKFKKTKASNMRDYADACVRYLRATGMVNISYSGHSLSIVPEKEEEVNYFLDYTDRKPRFVNDREQYIQYLSDPELPYLLTDDKDRLIERFKQDFPDLVVSASTSVEEMKSLLDTHLSLQRDRILSKEVEEIKGGKEYEDIKTVFRQIRDKDLYDIPLMLEWNVWRAMTMIDGGQIKANLKFDDYGKPLSTAQGNVSDIVCDYDDFDLTVEVTTATGQKQYEMEGEPVARHLGKHKKSAGKETFCLFVAPSINPATVSYFYMLQRTAIDFYGGESTIIPLDYSAFEKMLDDAFKASYTPQPEQVRRLFDFSKEYAYGARSEKEWYEAVLKRALNWLDER